MTGAEEEALSGDGIIYRPYGSVRPVGRGEPTSRRSQEAALRCRWCGRPTANTRGVIEHIDQSPGGTDWSEHVDCRLLPDRLDTNTDWRI